MPKKQKNGKVSNGIVPYTPAQSAVVQSIFESIPEGELVAALLDSGDPRAISLAERLSDKAFAAGSFDRTKLAKHCYELKLLPKDVWSILIDTRKTEARLKLSEKMVKLVDTVTEAALPQIVKCPRGCQDGMNPPKKKGDEPSVCSTCAGQGQIARPADKDMLKMALEMGEMINQKVPLIAQQFNSYQKPGDPGIGTAVPDMSDWARDTDKVFEEYKRPSNVVDAEQVG